MVLLSAFMFFSLVVVSAILAGRWAYQNATAPETASLSVVSGSGGALVRSPTDADWRLVTGDTTVGEGDRISTALGTVVTLTMFDGSTVEVAEDTIVRIARMRSSRFLKRTKLIVVEPEQGAVYVSMARRGDYEISEISMRVDTLRVTMTDEPGS
ncbi:MAG: hypothetical protein ACRD1H_11200, partial [Vicinamibacterales bacterium]